MFVVDDAAIRTGRDNLTGAEVAFMFASVKRVSSSSSCGARNSSRTTHCAGKMDGRSATAAEVSEMTVVRIKLGGCGSRSGTLTPGPGHPRGVAVLPVYASAPLEAAALSRPEGAALAMAAGVLPAFASVHSAAAVPCAELSRPGCGPGDGG